jgi:trans-aconitate methyltransferase
MISNEPGEPEMDAAGEEHRTPADPIGLMFGGMAKLGPGSDADTLHVLRLLPTQRFRLVVDAGCGTGRQTLALAREIGTPVHAVDSHEPFLHDLVRRAKEAQLGHLVQPHHMDMKDIPQAFQGIDLLWSEGAAYNIGFSNALTTLAPTLAAGGFAVVSELSWLKEEPPQTVREFFKAGYPDMRSLSKNIEVVEGAGYRLNATHTLPRESWVDGYYDILGERANALLDHPDPSVRAFASETIREIEVFDCSEDSYGYVFYVLERA